MKNWIFALLSQMKAVGNSCAKYVPDLRQSLLLLLLQSAHTVMPVVGTWCESCINWNKIPHQTKVKNRGIDKGESSPKMFRGGYSSKGIYFVNKTCPNTQQLHPERTLLPLYEVLLALLDKLVFHGIRSEQRILELPFLNLKSNLGLYPKKWAESYVGLNLHSSLKTVKYLI